MKQYKVAILGATGAVGREMMKILAERDFPVGELHLLASERSVGQELDFRGKKPGRGAYVCPKAECLAKVRKSRGLERAFSMAIPAEVYDQLEQQMAGEQDNA